MTGGRMVWFALVALAVSMPATARAPKGRAAAPEGSHGLDAALACRGVANDADRLACYDKAVADLAAARQRKDIYVVDRAEATRTRKNLFGFDLPSLKLFGGDDDDADEVKQVEGTLRSASQGAYGAWLFVLDDGTRWRQTDDFTFAIPPRAGQKVVVRKGALSAYKLIVQGSPGVKVKREN